MDKEYTTIKYTLANGRVINVEVTIPVKEALELIDRQDKTMRRKERRYRVALSPNEQLENAFAATQKSLADLLIEVEEHRLLKSSLAALPSKQRRRLLLYFVHGMTYKQIAEIEGVTENAVSETIKSALRFLRDVYRD